MIKIEKYLGAKTYMFPNGALATPEKVLAQFPACLAFAHIIETDENGEVMYAMQNLSAIRSQMGIDSALTELEAIAAIETARNTPPVEEPSTEERIAAALEYQNLMSMEELA